MKKIIEDARRSEQTHLRHYVRDVLVAEALGIQVCTVRKWRRLGKGPKWRRLSRAVVYDTTELQAWIDSQPGGGGQ